MKKDTIIYDGSFFELYKLLDDNGKVNTDKLYDWLSTSNHLKFDKKVSVKIKKEVRKRKIKKINEKEEFEDIIANIHCSTFHMNDKEAKIIIDKFIQTYPELLEYHDLDWYYKYC